MQYAPSQTELSALTQATPNELLNYFLTRAMEAEEVWSLGNELGWAMQERDGKSVLPVWPYHVLAEAHVQDEDAANIPDAVSLEHFVYNLLPLMIEQDIHIAIMPNGREKDLVMEAKALFEIVERKLDASEYFIEG